MKKYKWNKKKFIRNMLKILAMIFTVIFADACVIYYLYFM